MRSNLAVRTAARAVSERALRTTPGQWVVRRMRGTSNLYESVYEAHARAHDDARAVGGVEFDEFGRLELAILCRAGLRPDVRLFDMGCGTGRLAIHVVPFLSEGRYIGSDIAPTMLSRCRANLESRGIDRSRVELLRQPAARFPVADKSIDMFCAFSVFTHMEPEDTYTYLADAHRAVAAGGCFVLSCLPVENVYAQDVFLESASKTIQDRLGAVRNFVTSTALIEALAKWAGWSVREWYDGDKVEFDVPGMDRPMRLGQSVLILDPA